jgi:hypothetical protein
MSDQTGWWQSIEEHLAERESAAPDPWGDDAVEPSTLTADQEAFLAGLADQPVPPRLANPDGVETGNSPGDGETAPDVPSS